MGTLLVTAILGASCHLRQLRAVQRKKAGIETVERLLAAWSHYSFAQSRLVEAARAAAVPLTDVPETFPGSSSLTESPLTGVADISVRSQTRWLRLPTGLNLEIVRLEALLSTGGSDGEPLTWIEIVRAPRPDATSGGQERSP